MEKYIHYDIYIFPMVLLLLLWAIIQLKKIRTSLDRSFQTIIAVCFLSFFSDIICVFLDGNLEIAVPSAVYLGNIIYFIVSVMLSMTWLNYVLYYCHDSIHYHRTKTIRNIMLTPFIISVIFTILSPVNQQVFYVTADCMYSRGPLFWLPYVANTIYQVAAILALAQAYALEELPDRKRRILVIEITTIIPIICTVFQAMTHVWVALPMTAICLFYIYMDEQNRQITSDALTGLNNKDYFNSYLKRLMDEKEDFYLYVMDMDRFKMINDTYGHAEGDVALKNVANFLKIHLGRRRAFIARYGGDEFVAIMYPQDDKEAYEIMLSLKADLVRYNATRDKEYELSFSMGFAKYDESFAHKPRKLVDAADIMMYKDKEGKKR